MNKLINKAYNVILPDKKTNYLILGIILLGIIAGTIFIIVLTKNDKLLINNQITRFFTNIHSNDINNGQAFLNSLITNSLYIIIIWLLGMSIIGIPIILFLVFFKGFILGFSISSIISVYKAKGLLASLIYIFPAQIISVIIILLIGVYSINFSKYILLSIRNKKTNFFKPYFKKYIIVLGMSFIMLLISSVLDAFVVPLILKVIIKLYV